MKKAICAVCLLLPFIVLSQVTESAHHIEIVKGCLAPERAFKQLLLLDFANTDAKWDFIDNHEDKLNVGYGEKNGHRGFYLEGPQEYDKKKKHPMDTAWQVKSAKFPVKGMTNLKGQIEFFTSGSFAGKFTPFNQSYVNSVFWFAADGTPLGRTGFPVTIMHNGSTPIDFYLTVPEQAAEALLAVGEDNPNIKKGTTLMITSASIKGVGNDGVFVTDAEAILPPVRFFPDAPIRNYVSDTPATRWIQAASQCPKGTAVSFETAFAADNNGIPAAFSAFGPSTRPAPDGTAWVKCRIRFQTDGKACPSLRSVTICGKTFSGWKSLNKSTKPAIKRLSKSPSPNPSQPFIFSVTHDMPINWKSLKVILDGNDITSDLKREILPSNSLDVVGEQTEPLEAANFVYSPKEPFAMRTVHKAAITIMDIYGNAATKPLYFFFDEPLEKGAITLRDDGQMLLDGKPFFPIAAPYVIPLPVNDYNLDNAFTWLKEAGFNTVYSPRNKTFAEYMDKVASYGMKMYVMPGAINGANDKDLDVMLANIAREYRHPAVMGWYVGDDTLDHNTPEDMKTKYEAIKSVDPYHPTVQADPVNAVHPFAPVAAEDDPSRSRPVVNFTDTFRPELYPVRDFSEKNAMECVPLVIDDMKTIARDIRDMATATKHTWCVIQYFEGWGDSFEKATWKRFPTWQELRAMTWAAVIHGARGVQWYSYRYETKRFVHGFMYKEETRNNIRRMSQEIFQLVDVLVQRADAPAPAVTILSGPEKDAMQNDSISVMVRKLDGHTYIFALNSAYQPVKASIAAAGLSNGTVLYEDNRSVKVENGAITDDFQPYDVHIYKLK